MKIIATILVTSLLLISALTLANNSTNSINGTIDFSVKITENINNTSPVGDYKKMMKLVDEFTKLAIEIAEDKIITDEEVIYYKELAKKMDDLEQIFNAKYENNEKADAKIEKWEAKNTEKLELKYNNFFNAMMALYECDGFDKLGS
jgi:hypothetical protein